MSKDNNNSQLTDYEKYCQMMAQQQEEDMDELISGDMSEEAPEGVFVRGIRPSKSPCIGGLPSRYNPPPMQGD